MSAESIRNQIRRGAERATAKSRALLDRRAARLIERAAIGKVAGFAGFSPPEPVEMSTTLSRSLNDRDFCTVRIMGLRLISELNRREHHMVTYKRKEAQQTIVRHAMRISDLWSVFGLPLLVTIIRLAPKLIRDDDNRVSCAKHVVDQVARELGVDDSDKRVRWQVDQRRSKRYGVEIVIEPRIEI